MARRKRLTDEQVTALQPKAKRYTHPDPELSAHYVRVYPSGAKSFVVVFNNKWTTIGDAKVFSIEQAREKARKILHAAQTGEAAPESFKAVAAKWVDKHVIAKGLRSANDIDRHLGLLIDAFGDRDFASVRRLDVINLIDEIAEERGRRTAKYVFQVCRGLMSWYACRDENYLSPIVRGMADALASKARDRVLDDDEIRAVWELAGRSGQFGAILKLLLLTGQRRMKVASMRWEDLDGNVWTIATEEREKNNAVKLVLPQVVLDILNEQQRHLDNGYIFAAHRSGGVHFHNFSRAKRELDAKLGKMPPWTIHDLRRTASSLMARAGVRPDIGERVLGHAIPGVAGVYNRHSYDTEKADALKTLANIIGSIVDPAPRTNVTPLPLARTA
jgi:integrase